METVHLTIDYESQEPGGFESVQYKMSKILNFPKLPLINGCWVVLEHDAIGGFRFRDVVYHPKQDMYYIVNRSDEGVERYYHGDAEVIMAEVVSRFKHNGWQVEKVKQ